MAIVRYRDGLLWDMPEALVIPPPYVLVVDANRLHIAPGKLRRPPLA